MKKPSVIIIDDNFDQDDPLVLELEDEKYIVKSFKHAKKGFSYIEDNLTERMIVILDIDLGSNEPDGHEVLKMIREKTKLIPVIIWSVRNCASGEDLTDFINNHALFFVEKAAETDHLVDAVEYAGKMLRTDVATAIEQWLDDQDDKDQVMLIHGNGHKYTAIDLIREIRQQTKTGVDIQEKMQTLAIDLLFRKKETI